MEETNAVKEVIAENNPEVSNVVKEVVAESDVTTSNTNSSEDNSTMSLIKTLIANVLVRFKELTSKTDIEKTTDTNETSTDEADKPAVSKSDAQVSNHS